MLSRDVVIWSRDVVILSRDVFRRSCVFRSLKATILILRRKEATFIIVNINNAYYSQDFLFAPFILWSTPAYSYYKHLSLQHFNKEFSGLFSVLHNSK